VGVRNATFGDSPEWRNEPTQHAKPAYRTRQPYSPTLLNEFTCCFPKGNEAIFLLETNMINAMKPKKDLLQRTWALEMLKTLDLAGPLHG
jgi:hypothetical protein